MNRGKASLLRRSHVCKDSGTMDLVVARRLVGDITVALCWNHPASHDHCRPAITLHGDESCHWSSAIGHFEGLAVSDPLQIAAGMLTELANPDSIHVLQRSTWTRAENALRASPIEALR